jgi:hypothetical protein
MYHIQDSANYYEDAYLARKKKIPDGVILPYKLKQFNVEVKG